MSRALSCPDCAAARALMRRKDEAGAWARLRAHGDALREAGWDSVAIHEATDWPYRQAGLPVAFHASEPDSEPDHLWAPAWAVQLVDTVLFEGMTQILGGTGPLPPTPDDLVPLLRRLAADPVAQQLVRTSGAEALLRLAAAAPEGSVA